MLVVRALVVAAGLIHLLAADHVQKVPTGVPVVGVIDHAHIVSIDPTHVVQVGLILTQIHHQQSIMVCPTNSLQQMPRPRQLIRIHHYQMTSVLPRLSMKGLTRVNLCPLVSVLRPYMQCQM